jgi:hypothetical protein
VIVVRVALALGVLLMAVFDIVGERLLLLTLYPYDPVGAGTVTLRVADRDFNTGPADAPANTSFDGFLLAMPVEQHLVAPGRLRGASTGMRGSARVGNPSRDDGTSGRKLDAWHGYAWQGARWTLDVLEAGSAIGAATRLLAGSVDGPPQEDHDDILITFRDRAADLAKDIQVNKYTGAGGFNGGAELTAKYKPLGFGLCRRVAAILVDALNLWYDLNDGAISAVLEVTDKGINLPADASNPPAAGKYYADLANGRIRLGASPVGELRVSFRGDASGSGYVSAHADIMRRIVTTRGATPLTDPADVDTASFTALNTAASYEAGIWIGTEQRAIASVLDDLASSLGSGYWVFNGQNQLSVGLIQAPTATSTTADLVLTEYEITLDTLQRQPLDTPPYQILGQYSRYYGPLDRTALGAITDAAKADWAQEWRAVTSSNAATLIKYPFSVPLPVPMLVDATADAQALADALKNLISVDRRSYTAETGWQVLQLALAQQVWLSHAYKDIAAGMATRLLGWSSADLVKGFVVPELWG